MTLKVALLGCGVVGSQVGRLMHEQADDLAARIGRRWSSPVSPCGGWAAGADTDVDPALLTTDAEALVTRTTWTSSSR